MKAKTEDDARFSLFFCLRNQLRPSTRKKKTSEEVNGTLDTNSIFQKSGKRTRGQKMARFLLISGGEGKQITEQGDERDSKPFKFTESERQNA